MSSSFWSQHRVVVTGGAGFLGRAVCARLREAGAREIFVPRSKEFDLTHADAVARMFDAARPDVVIHLAAEVGGIGANQMHPGRFFYASMAMGLHLIEEARRRAVSKFVQVGTVCSYPKFCETPFTEEHLWNGFPEATNAPYGIAKRALQTMLAAYHAQYGFPGVYLIPANLYGPGDNFDLDTAHVIPALIRKFTHAAAQGEREVVAWGTGRASREFLFVDDAAAAIVRAAELVHDPIPLNIGTGEEITIAQLAALIARRCGFHGTIRWDASRPDGQPRRRLDTARAEQRIGWRASVSLEDGLLRTIQWWRENGAWKKREQDRNSRGHPSRVKVTPPSSHDDPIRMPTTANPCP